MKKSEKLSLITNFLMAALFACTLSEVSAQPYPYPSYIQVTIICLQATSSDSCNERMDFYGRMIVNGKKYFFNHIIEGNQIYPQWNVRTTAQRDYNWVWIRIMDEDDAFCGGGDDFVDINPENGITELNLRIDSNTRYIYTIPVDSSQPVYIGNVGHPITLHGFDDDRVYEVTPFYKFGSGIPAKITNRNVETGIIHFRVDFY